MQSMQSIAGKSQSQTTERELLLAMAGRGGYRHLGPFGLLGVGLGVVLLWREQELLQVVQRGDGGAGPAKGRWRLRQRMGVGRGVGGGG